MRKKRNRSARLTGRISLRGGRRETREKNDNFPKVGNLAGKRTGNRPGDQAARLDPGSREKRNVRQRGKGSVRLDDGGGNKSNQNTPGPGKRNMKQGCRLLPRGSG